ncbi:hypothetical protein [Acetobacter malorum]|uniref:hypothetical protein n=1 Tax=Acetobacter malorum TaxID=178901 RepID=UPI0039E7E873
MGDMAALTSADPRLDDHERRITALEQGVVSIQLKLAEVQTEGRMRGERQERDTRDLKVTTDNVKTSVDDILRSMILLFRGLKWSWLAITGIGGFVAIYGDKLILFWQHLHQ